MELLNPGALYALFALPLLFIPYLIRRRTRRVVFSSLLLLRELAPRPLGRPWGKLRLPPIFFLQLLLLLLLIGALGEPVVTVRPTRIAVVLDNSASMQAIEGRKSRFELAQERLRALLADLSSRSRVDLYLTTPRLEPFGEPGLAPGSAAAIVGKLRPYDLGEAPDPYGDQLARLAKDKGYERVLFLTDHPVRGQSGVVRFFSVGQPRDNLAITSFRVTRPSFSSQQLEARVEVTSFSSKDGKVPLLLKADGKILASRDVAVAAGRRTAATFSGIPPYPAYEAELKADDALALDNHRFALAPPAGGLDILAISPKPEPLYSLRSIAGLKLKVISPEDYERENGEDHSLEIFLFSAPSSLPRKHALFVLPPGQNPLVGVGQSLSKPLVSGWREPQVLTRYVNFALFRPAYARVLKPLALGETIIQAPEGALAVALEHDGFRYLALGFDPFPYLGKVNLPMSIFTLNLLEWFDEGLGGSSGATGEPLRLIRGAGKGLVVTPKGESIAVGADQGLFPRTFYQGFYQVAQGEKKELVAVNLKDATESDLLHLPPIQVSEAPGAGAARSFLFSLWPYILLLSVLLLLIEWFANPPVTQP